MLLLLVMFSIGICIYIYCDTGILVNCRGSGGGFLNKLG